MSKDLIRDYNDKQQAQYSSNLEIPKVAAPKLQDATPVDDKQFQVATPQGQPLEQMVAPTPDKELGMLSNEQLQNPEQNVTLSFNDRLSRQLPTLLFGEPTDAERRSNEFYDWVGSQIEDNRKRSAAQAMTMPSLSQYNTPTQTQPNGFGQNVLKGLFGSDKTNASDDGILGNEFDITKGRFGQYGNGAVGGLMYFLDNTLGLGAIRNSLMDTAANLSSQAAGWTASGGVLDTLFKTGDVGKSIIAGSNRQKQALRNIYGGETPTSFLIQGAIGRDLGALGNLSGDSHDDYRKLYGSSPVAAGLDRAFFGRSLTEQETKDYEKLTGYSVKQTLDMFAGGENKSFNFTPEEQREYNEILGRVPEDFKTKMLLRNITGLVTDIKADDLLKPLSTINRAQKASNAVVAPKLPALEGSPTRLELLGSSPTQRALPPRERMTGAADEYMYNWLRRGDPVDITPRSTETLRLGGSTDPWLGGAARGNDPWVTIDATAVRVPDALPGVDNAALPYAMSSPRPPSTPLDSVIGNRTITALPDQEFINSVNASVAKALVVSPPIDAVRSPLQESVADVLRQQYMTRVEPGQYILQRLGTVADTDPIIALKSVEPAPRVIDPVRLALPPSRIVATPSPAPNRALAKFFSNTDEALAIRNNYAAKTALDNFLGNHLKDRAITRSLIDEALSSYFNVDDGLDQLRRGIEDGSIATKDVIDVFNNMLDDMDDMLSVLGYNVGRGWSKTGDNQKLGSNEIRPFKKFEGTAEELESRLLELMKIDEERLASAIEDSAREAGITRGADGSFSLGDLFKMADSVDSPKYDSTLLPETTKPSQQQNLEGTALSQKSMTLDEFARGFFRDTKKISDTERAFSQSEGAKTTQFWYEDKLTQEQIRRGLPKTEVPEVKPKLIPSSKEELLRKAREKLEADKRAARGEVETPKAESNKGKAEPNDVVVKSEVPAKDETPKQRMLREAREKLDAEKAQRRLEAAVTDGIAKPVDNGVEVRVDLDNPKGQELLNDAIDFDTLFNKTYSFEDLDTMVSMVSRAAAGAPLSFVGKVAPINETARSQKEIYRFASLVPDPLNPGKPLLAPTKSMVAEYAAKYGVEHPYASSAIADSSMKYLTKNGGARRHKSLADLAAEQSNPLYRKILSPTGTPIPLAVIERFEKQISQGGQALVKTSSDTVSAIDTANPVVGTQSPKAARRTRIEAQKFVDDNNLGIKKNLSADKLNDALSIFESKGLDAVPDEYFTKSGLSKRNAATQIKQGRDALKQSVVETKREVKVEVAAKKVVKTETLEDFEDAVVKLEDMEPTIEELERIQKKMSSLPIFDHRKKLSSPSHTNAVVSDAKTNPKTVAKQKRYEELTTQLQEVVTQEQELVKTKQVIDVAVDDVDAQQQARVSKFMERYGMARSDAQEFDETLQALVARSGVDKPVTTEDAWTRSRKASMKGVTQSLFNVDDMKIAPNYETLRQASIDSGEYEKAAAWLYQNSGTKKSTNPVISIAEDGSINFVSGNSTFFAAMDSGLDEIPVQILSDARAIKPPQNISVSPVTNIVTNETTPKMIVNNDPPKVIESPLSIYNNKVDSIPDTLRSEGVKPFALQRVVDIDSDTPVSGLGYYTKGKSGVVVIKPDVWDAAGIDAALAPYYGGGYLGINDYLRRGIEYLKSSTKYDDKDITRAVYEAASVQEAVRRLPSLTPEEALNNPEFARLWQSYEKALLNDIKYKRFKGDLPNPKRDIIPLYRGTVGSYFEDVKVGDVFVDAGIASASPAEYVAKRFMKHGINRDTLQEYQPTMLKIVNHFSAKLTTNTNELEILFDNPSFRVLDIQSTESIPKLLIVEQVQTVPAATQTPNAIEVVKKLDEIPQEVKVQPQQPISKTLGDALKWTTTKQGATNPIDVASILDSVDVFETPVTIKQFKNDVSGYEVPSVKPWYSKKQERLQLNVYPLEALKETYTNPLVKTVVDNYKRGGMEAAVKAYIDSKTTNPITGKRKPFNVSVSASDEDYIPKDQLKDVVYEIGGILRLIPYLENASAAKKGTLETASKLATIPQDAKLEDPKGSYTFKSANEDLLATSLLGNNSFFKSDDAKILKRLSPLMEDGTLSPTKLEEYLISKSQINVSSVFTLDRYGELTAFISRVSTNPARDFKTLADKFSEITTRKDNPFLQGIKALYATPESANAAYKENVKKVKQALNNSVAVAESIKLQKGEDVAFISRTPEATTSVGYQLDQVTQSMRIENNAIMLNGGNSTNLPTVTTNSREGFIEAFRGLTLDELPNRSLESDGSLKLLQLFSVSDSADQGFDGRWLNIKDLKTASGDVVFTPYRNGGSLYRFINAYLRNGIEGIAGMVESYSLEAMVSKGKASSGALIRWDDEGLRRATLDALYYIPILRKAISDMPVYNALKYKTDPNMKLRLLNPQAPDSVTTRKDHKLVRGLPHKFIAELKQGDVFVDDAFISSTINYEHAVKFAKSMLGTSTANPEQGSIMVFNTSRNAHITPNRLENEVLFAPGNKFVVDDIKTEKGLPTYYVSQVDDLDNTLLGGNVTRINLESGEVYTSPISREQLSRQNINDALDLSRQSGKGSLNDLVLSTPPSQNLKVTKRRNPDASLPTTVGQAVSEFKEALATVNRTGALDDRTQIKLNNAVYAMESLEDKSYAQSMREVVARMTGRGVDEGKPFMSAAVEMLHDGKPRSRDEIADILSYAVGTKDVKFATNLTDEEVLKFSRFIAQRPETMSQFDHLYVGHGTGIVEHGTWSLEARPTTGYAKRELIQHVIDNTYPRGTEVGVAACETGCPKRIQDAVPPLHRVVSRGTVGNTLDNLQRLVEELSSLPVPTKIMDVFAQYDGLLREAMTANKQRSLDILQEMSAIEDEFNSVNKKYKFKSEQQVRAKMKQAQDAIEKDLLGDC